MNETNPLVSIIIPVHNGEKTIRQTIKSCLDQTYSQYEIIVVDNASTDATRDIVESFRSDAIRYNRMASKGRSIARNEGLRISKGEYIQFLDADDLLDKQKLARGMRLISETQATAVQCATAFMKDGSIIRIEAPYSEHDFYPNLVTANTIPIHSIIVRKHLCGQFPPGVDYCEDWTFWIETLRGATLAFDLEYVGAIVRVHDANTRSDTQAMKNYQLRVLMQYESIKLPLRYAALRKTRMLKRYAEYVVCSSKKDPIIEQYASYRLSFTGARLLLRIGFIEGLIKERIDLSNRANIFLTDSFTEIDT